MINFSGFTSLFSNVNRNQMKLYGAVGVLLLIVLGVALYAGGKQAVIVVRQPIEVKVWGTQANPEDLRPIFDKFQEDYQKTYLRKVTVTYQSWDQEEFEDALVNKIAEKQGPNVALVKSTWLLKHYPKFAALKEVFATDAPAGYIPATSAADITSWTPEQVERVYVPVAQDVVLNRKIYAVPFWVDTLALFYNQDAFRQANLVPMRPAGTWQGIEEQITALRVSDYSSSGGIWRAAIALGTVEDLRVRAQRSNHPTPTYVDNGVDIVSLFVLQHGGSFCTDFCQQVTLNASVQEAFADYLRFSTRGDARYTWSPGFLPSLGRNDNVNDDVDAFVSGDVAMILGYPELEEEIINRQASGSFTVKVTGVPQLADENGEVEERVTLGSTWGFSVIPSTRTDGLAQPVNQAAMELAMYMGRREHQRSYLEATKRSSARQDLISHAGKTFPEFADVYKQVLVAESLQVYDDRVVAQALTDALHAAVTAEPGSQQAEPGTIVTRLREVIGNVTSGPARTPPPPKPSAPPGAR